MNHMLSILAQATGGGPAGGGAAGGQQPSPAATFFPFALILAMFAFIFLTSRSQKKREKRERDNMFERLSKNDRVLTIGGVIGTVIQVKDAEVVLKVDESTNTKMTFLKTSVQRIITEEHPIGT